MIHELFNSIQVIILDLLSVLGLRDLNLFLVLKLINDAVTINRPGMVDELLPNFTHFICSPFMAMFEDMVSHGTSQPLILVIYYSGIAVASPATSSVTRSAASLSSNLSSSSTHASVEVQL